MDLKRDSVWCYNMPTLEELEAAAKADAEVKARAMWMSRWLDGQDLKEMLDRCVPFYLRIGAVRCLAGKRPRASLTATISRDTAYGLLKRECAQICSPGLTEFVKGLRIELDYYGEDCTAKLVRIYGKAEGASEPANDSPMPQEPVKETE